MKSKFVFLALLFLKFGLMQAQTFHAIIFADTYDGSIGESCLKDYEYMAIEFGTIARANNMTLKDYYYRDYDFSTEKLTEVLSNLKCGSEDIVVFYASCHGSRTATDQSQFPQLAFPKKSVPLATIDKAIENKKPRLRIIISDACNSFVKKPVKDMVSGNVTELKNSMISNYQSLFRKQSGSIIITSSSVGETSAAMSEGGAFTIALRRALQEVVSGSRQVSWLNLLTAARTYTQDFAGHKPLFDIQIQQVATVASAPVVVAITPPTPAQQPANVNYINAFVSIADHSKGEMQRINLISSTLKYFASPQSKVAIVSKSGTVVEVEKAEDFIKRLSTAQNLIQITEVGSKKDANGKITELKVHEVYKF